VTEELPECIADVVLTAELLSSRNPWCIVLLKLTVPSECWLLVPYPATVVMGQADQHLDEIFKNEDRTSGSGTSWLQVYDQGIYSAIMKYYTPACPFRRGKFRSREMKGIFEVLNRAPVTQLQGVEATGCDA